MENTYATAVNGQHFLIGESMMKDYISLQNHGTKVWYRNIKIEKD